MKKYILVIICILSSSSFAQTTQKASDFHRLLIFNKDSDLLVVKIKDTDFWVTPGLYGLTDQLTEQNLFNLATEYNLRITKPDLRGVFVLKNNQTKAVLPRYFYTANVVAGEIKIPDNIEEIKWLQIDKAMQVITFPHINILVKQIIEHPETIWAGTILRYQQDNQLKAKMLESFYPYGSVN
jgi:hypothetical protein